MSVHIVMAGSSERGLAAQRIAKCRLRLSMIAMKELSSYWPVCSWVFQLFAKIIRDRHYAATGTTVPAAVSRSPHDNTTMEATDYGSSHPNNAPPIRTVFDRTIDVADLFSQFLSDVPNRSDFSQFFDIDMGGISDSEYFQP